MLHGSHYSTMKIGELAKRTGVSISAIPFYERQGLLCEPERRESGYREYAEVDVQRVRLIAAAKKQRFPLKVIRLCLDALEGAEEPCREVAAVVGQKIAQLDQEIGELSSLRNSLSEKVKAWTEGRLPAGDCLCAILESQPRSSTRSKP